MTLGRALGTAVTEIVGLLGVIEGGDQLGLTVGNTVCTADGTLLGL